MISRPGTRKWVIRKVMSVVAATFVAATMLGYSELQHLGNFPRPPEQRSQMVDLFDFSRLKHFGESATDLTPERNEG